MDVDFGKTIVYDAFGYDINNKTDAKYFIGYETDNRIITLFIEVP